MSRLLDHVKPPIVTTVQLDKMRALFIAGRLKPQGFAYTNGIVAGLIARIEVAEENAKTLQGTLDDVKKQLDAARKDLE